MGTFTVGQVISSSFPFSDLSTSKKRPAIIVAVVDFDNIILCQVTSKPYSSTRAIALSSTDFESGGLSRESFIRPDKLFTADSTVVDNIHGILKEEKTQKILEALRRLFS